MAQYEKMEQKDLMLMRQWEDVNSLMEKIELLELTELTEEKEEQLWDTVKKRIDALLRLNEQMKEEEKQTRDEEVEEAKGGRQE